MTYIYLQACWPFESFCSNLSIHLHNVASVHTYIDASRRRALCWGKTVLWIYVDTYITALPITRNGINTLFVSNKLQDSCLRDSWLVSWCLCSLVTAALPISSAPTRLADLTTSLLCKLRSVQRRFQDLREYLIGVCREKVLDAKTFESRFRMMPLKSVNKRVVTPILALLLGSASENRARVDTIDVQDFLILYTFLIR